ncbi:unnamed protein product [Cunninghamella blakesleeana]
MTSETGTSLSQRSFRIRKSLRDLTYKPRIHKRRQSSLPLPSLPSHLNDKDDYVYDILYECQRGSWLIGYSTKTLLQFDPNPWCDTNMKFTPMTPTTYQLPDPTWEWVSKEWMVDMTDDVDEAGWQYAVNFHGAVWHGNYKHFRSFVRRRRWIRLRHKINGADALNIKNNKHDKLTNGKNKDQIKTRILVDVDDLQEEELQQPETSNTLHDDHFMKKLENCRLDRERISLLDSLITSLSEDQLNQMIKDELKLKKYLDSLDFENSKRIIIQKIIDINHNNNQLKKPIPLTSLSPEEKNLLQLLTFCSDIYTILHIQH